MPAHDNRSDQLSQLVFTADITGNTTDLGFILDTINFDRGILFEALISGVTDTPNGEATISLFEDDVIAFNSPATLITGDNLIGTPPVLSSGTANVNGDLLSTFGVISVKRFVRITSITTNQNTGTRNIRITAVKRSDFSPIAT